MAQVPMAFNYQGVARNSDFSPASNDNISVLLNISEGSSSGTIVYQEEHFNVQTSPTGVFSLQIGNGQATIGNMSDINWSNDQHYLTSFIDLAGGSDFVEMGSAELVSVPYALQAASAADDGDRDAANEIQNLSFDNNTGELSLSSGNTVTIPLSSGGDNWGSQTVRSDQSLSGSGTSSDPLTVNGDLTDDQTLSISGNELSISGGNSVTLQDQTEDADADPTNEIQTLSRDGDEIKLSNGGSFTDNFEDDDADPDNELQTLSRNGDEIILSDGGGSFFDEFEDDDADPDNELQILELDGNELSISDGNSVFLPNSNSPWSQNAFGFPYVQEDVSVGIGTSTPAEILHIKSDQVKTGLLLEGPTSSTILCSNFAGYVGTRNSTDFHLVTEGNTRMMIDTDGFIGMGTALPKAKLHLVNESFYDVEQLLVQSGRVETTLASDRSHEIAYVGSISDHDFSIVTNGLSQMTITNDGDVGIGTSFPEEKLHIRDGGAAVMKLENTQVETILGANTIGYVGTDNAKDFAIITDGRTRMTINQSGRVGINENSPITELHITEQNNLSTSPQLLLSNAGKRWTLGTNSSTGSLRFSSTTGGLWYINEDGSPSSLIPEEEDQSSFKSLSTEEKKLTSLKTFSYFKNGATRYSLEKESIKEHFPELLTEEEIELEDGTVKTFTGYKYDQLIPILINTINEQEQLLNQQNDRIKTLESALISN